MIEDGKITRSSVEIFSDSPIRNDTFLPLRVVKESVCNIMKMNSGVAYILQKVGFLIHLCIRML